jgi:tRNA nucleotidyltransferase (CCA-adding enzyme)
MADATGPADIEPAAEQFPHGADIGVRGIGRSREEAFEHAAVALTGIVTDPERVAPRTAVAIECGAPSDGLLLADWLNRLICEMAVRRMLFRRFSVRIEDGHLTGRAWGEPVDRARHAPAVEPKSATPTALAVEQRPDGAWVVECVIGL